MTSFSAGAAKSNLPLAFQNEELLVLSVPESPLKLKDILVEAKSLRRVVVLLKLGDKWTWVQPLLQELGLLEKSIFAERVGFLNEKIVKAIELPPATRPYFSLLLIRQDWSLIMS